MSLWIKEEVTYCKFPSIFISFMKSMYLFQYVGTSIIFFKLPYGVIFLVTRLVRRRSSSELSMKPSTINVSELSMKPSTINIFSHLLRDFTLVNHLWFVYEWKKSLLLW